MTGNKSKIIITGAAGVGKTTLFDELKSQSRLQYNFVDEVVKRVCAERGYASPYDIKEDHIEFRHDVLKKQIELEQAPFIADRSVIDAWAYFMRWSWNQATVEKSEDFYQAAYTQAQNYDLIIFIPIMFEAKDDGFRWNNAIYQKQMERLLLSTIKDWGLEDRLYIVQKQGLEERLEEISRFFI